MVSAPIQWPTSIRTFTRHDEMHGAGVLNATLQVVSKPLGNETSQRANSSLTCTVTDLRRNSGRAVGKDNSRNYVLQPSGKNRVPIVSYETGERA